MSISKMQESTSAMKFMFPHFDNPYAIIINDYVQSCDLQENPDPKVYYEAVFLAVDEGGSM